ncbi:MAG: hypothetical protein NTY69_09655 [Methylococcales bacterium]|nr:hypothetical protein [Methylococcales bacterium]
MKKINKSPLATAMGAALISTVSATAVYADTNPFGMTELSTGYMQVAAAEMKCGAAMDMNNKTAEGACAGAQHPKKADEKASDASCGAMMKDGKMKPGMEMACGAMMKGKEGACGQMKEGETMKGKEGACGAAK